MAGMARVSLLLVSTNPNQVETEMKTLSPYKTVIVVAALAGAASVLACSMASARGNGGNSGTASRSASVIRSPDTVVRDHRAKPTVRDHRGRVDKYHGPIPCYGNLC